MNQPEGRTITILVADDDPDDRMMTREALTESHLANDLRFVEDGEELLDYLQRRGKYTDPADSPLPGVILLDLNMPKKDGREALREIKQDPRLRRIPIIVLTTSRADEDLLKTYDLGVSGYIPKPVGFDSFVSVMKTMSQYWFEVVALPPAGHYSG